MNSVSFNEFLTLVGNDKNNEPTMDHLIIAFQMFDK